MVSKPNKQSEKQARSKASSSSRARELLPTNNGFSVFSSFRPPTTSAHFSERFLADSSTTVQDDELELLIKALGKKKTETKLRTIQRLIEAILPDREPYQLRPLIGPFCNFYILEFQSWNPSTNTCYPARQGWNTLLLALVQKMRPKAFASYLSRLLPAWFFAMHDSNKLVACTAKLAFDTLYQTQEKRQEIIRLLLDNLLVGFEEYLQPYNQWRETKSQETDIMSKMEIKKNQAANTKSERADDQEQVYFRYVGAAISSLTTIIKMLTQDKLALDQSLLKDIERVLGLTLSPNFARLTINHAPNRSKVQHESDGTPVIASQQDNVRGDTWTLLRTICEIDHLTQFIASSPDRMVYYGKLTLGNALDERSMQNKRNAWELVFYYLQTCKNLWDQAGMIQYFQTVSKPRLMAQVRHGFYGTAEDSFDKLLPLLSLFPNAINFATNTSCDDFQSVYIEFLEQIWLFVVSKFATIDEKMAALQSFFEILTASLSIFLNQESTYHILAILKSKENDSSDIHSYSAKYVSKYENLMLALLSDVLFLPKLGTKAVDSTQNLTLHDSIAEKYIAQLLLSAKSLSKREGKEEFVGTVGASFTNSLRDWLHMLLAQNFVEDRLHHRKTVSRILLLLRRCSEMGANAETGKIALSLCDSLISQEIILELIAQCMGVLQKLNDISQLDATKFVKYRVVSGLMQGLCDIYGPNILFEAASSSGSGLYALYIQPSIRTLALAYHTKDSDASSDVSIAFYQFLHIAGHSILSNASDKCKFVAQLFQDARIFATSNLSSVLSVLRHALQLPIDQFSFVGWLDVLPENVVILDNAMVLEQVSRSKVVDDLLWNTFPLEQLQDTELAELIQVCVGDGTYSPLLSVDSVILLVETLKQTNRRNLCLQVWPIFFRFFEKCNLSCCLKSAAEYHKHLLTAEIDLALYVFYLIDSSHRSLWNLEGKALINSWSVRLQEEFLEHVASTLREQIKTENLMAHNSVIDTENWVSLASKYFDAAIICEQDTSPFAVPRLVKRIYDFSHDCPSNMIDSVSTLLLFFGELCEQSDNAAETLGIYFSRQSKSTVFNVIVMDSLNVLRSMALHFGDSIHQDEDLSSLANSVGMYVYENLSLIRIYTILSKSSLLMESICERMLIDVDFVYQALEQWAFVLSLRRKVKVNEVCMPNTLGNEQIQQLYYQMVTVVARCALSDALHTLIVSNLACITSETYNNVELRERSFKVIWQWTAITLEDPDTSCKQASDTLAFVQIWLQSADSAVLADLKKFQFAIDTISSLLRGDKALFTDKIRRDCSLAAVQLLSLLNDVLSQQYNTIDGSFWLSAAGLVLSFQHDMYTNSTYPRDGEEIWLLCLKELLLQIFVKFESNIGILELHKNATSYMRGLTSNECTSANEMARIALGYPLASLRYWTCIIRLIGSGLLLQNVTNEDSEPNIHESFLGMLYELAPHYRESLLLMVLYSLRDGICLHDWIVRASLEHADSPSSSFVVVSECLALARLFGMKSNVQNALVILYNCIRDDQRLRELAESAFGELNWMFAAFDPGAVSNIGLEPLKCMYWIISECKFLRLHDPAEEIDEVLADIAFAKRLIPSVFQDTLENCTNEYKSDEKNNVGTLRVFLIWDLFLQIMATTAPSDLSEGDGRHSAASKKTKVSALVSYAVHNGYTKTFMTKCVTLLSREAINTDINRHASTATYKRLLARQGSVFPSKEDISMDVSAKEQIVRIGIKILFRTVTRFPSMLRNWYNDECPRSLRAWITKHFEEHITPQILLHELELIEKVSRMHIWDESEMTVKGSKVSREIITAYIKDDCTLEMVLRIPTCYPLRTVEIECAKRIGIPEDRWRRWVLQIVKTCSLQDGALVDAVMLWKRNVDQEFDGVSPCPICYCIIYPKTMAFPNLTCKTCKTKFHNTCLYKWFNQSGKSKCAICQQPFT